MIRINDETPEAVLREVKAGKLITDTFSKTGLVESVDIEDDGLYTIYRFMLVTGRIIMTRR